MSFKLSNGFAFLMFVGPASVLSVSASTIDAKTPVDASVDVKDNTAHHNITTLNNVVFTSKPAMCVALTQGRTCYANIKIEWNAQTNSDFCIFHKAREQYIKCWKNLSKGVHSFEFQSKEPVTYQLINAQNKPIAETTVDVSWVHKKSPRKRRWRLF